MLVPDGARLPGETPYDADLAKWAQRQLEGSRHAATMIVALMGKKEGYLRGAAATEYAASYYEAEIAENWRHINLLYDQLAEAVIRTEPYRALVAAAERATTGRHGIASMRVAQDELRTALVPIREMEGATLGDDDAA